MSKLSQGQFPDHVPANLARLDIGGYAPMAADFADMGPAPKDSPSAPVYRGSITVDRSLAAKPSSEKVHPLEAEIVDKMDTYNAHMSFKRGIEQFEAKEKNPWSSNDPVAGMPRTDESWNKHYPNPRKELP